MVILLSILILISELVLYTGLIFLFVGLMTHAMGIAKHYNWRIIKPGILMISISSVTLIGLLILHH